MPAGAAAPRPPAAPGVRGVAERLRLGDDPASIVDAGRSPAYARGVAARVATNVPREEP